jgi:excisionase family DNA binding protein
VLAQPHSLELIAMQPIFTLFPLCITLSLTFIGRQCAGDGVSVVSTLYVSRILEGVMMPLDRQPLDSGSEDRLLKSVKEPLLDSHQAAAMLKVHPRTLQRLVHRGKIHAVQVGKLWRFKASAIEEWIDQ